MCTNWDHPYSPVVVSHGIIFVSGCLPGERQSGGATTGRDLIDSAIETVERRLQTVHATLADVVKLTYFVTDIGLRDAVNDQYVDLWDEPRPARTVIGVSVLPKGQQVEIDAIAQLPHGRFDD
jgi:enamine deaminase RidA (YjgF/YER057c/UK114 family)